MGAATARKRVSEYLDSLPLEEEQRTRTYRSLCRLTTDREVRMNQEKARAMAQTIINEVEEKFLNQAAPVHTGVVPDLDRLTKAIQTYAAARYVIYPDVWSKERYTFPYALVEADWSDDKWSVQVYYRYTYPNLPFRHKVIPLPSGDYLRRRDGRIELTDGTLLHRDPTSGVYLTEGYRPPHEILQA